MHISSFSEATYYVDDTNDSGNVWFWHKNAFNGPNSRPIFNLPVLKWIERRDSLICNNPFVTRNWKRSSIDQRIKNAHYGVLSRHNTMYQVNHIHTSNNDIKKPLVGCVTMDIANQIELHYELR